MTSKKSGWIFRFLQGSGQEGPSDGSADHFKGNRLNSLLRELLQNSIDAASTSEDAAIVIIDLKKIDASDFDGFTGIWPHVQSCSKFYEDLNKTGDAWYRKFKAKIEANMRKKAVSVLCFHDGGGCRGLTGPIDGTPEGAYDGIKGQGISDKPTAGAGGNFGHGASAANVYSAIGSVFYYSQIKEKHKELFFGKIRLRSHKHPTKKSKDYTRAIGYYGTDLDEESILPLLGSDIPSWAKNFRKEHNLEEGCSAYIPYTDFKEDHFSQAIISIVSNFYMAFKDGQLEVIISGKRINSSNIDEIYEEYKQIFYEYPIDSMLLDEEKIKESFKFIETVKNPSQTGTQEVSGFGPFDWYLRLGEELNTRKVGISRSTGMLITREPSRLVGFNAYKYFDMHISVKGNKGNNILQALEDPTHSAFNFDRISDRDSSEIDAIERGYKNFVKKIREVLKIHAKHESDEEGLVEEAYDLFGDTEKGSKVAKNPERGNEMRLLDGPILSLKKSFRVGPKIIDVEKQKRKKPDDPADPITPKPEPINPEKKTVKIKPGKGKKSIVDRPGIACGDPRIVKLAKDGKKIRLLFSPESLGEYNIKLIKKGENGDDEMLFKNGYTSHTIKIKTLARHEIELDITEDIDNFVVEGMLYEVAV